MAARAEEVAIPPKSGHAGRDEKGKFVKGNTCGTGRPRSARQKIAEDFLQDFTKVWEERGTDAIQEVAEKQPAKFVEIAASMVPKEQKLSVTELRTFVVELTGRQENDVIEHEDLPRLDIADPDETAVED